MIKLIKQDFIHRDLLGHCEMPACKAWAAEVDLRCNHRMDGCSVREDVSQEYVEVSCPVRPGILLAVPAAA
jgi:hypothetical protein